MYVTHNQNLSFSQIYVIQSLTPGFSKCMSHTVNPTPRHPPIRHCPPIRHLLRIPRPSSVELSILVLRHFHYKA